jgi:hypothetical protein
VTSASVCANWVDPNALINEEQDNLDPAKIWACLMTNEKPGSHGERSVAVGTIDMSVWDAVSQDR